MADNYIQIKCKIEALDINNKNNKVLKANNRKVFRRFKSMTRKYYTGKVVRIFICEYQMQRSNFVRISYALWCFEW
jgi:hypothetical protein